MSNEVTTQQDSLELQDLSPMIAAELAAGLSEPKTIRERYNLSLGQWKALCASPTFRGMLREAVTKFRGDMNAGARITLKAEVLLEDAMPEIYHIIKNPLAANADKINALKQLSELAGRVSKAVANPASGTGGFTLNINVGKGQGVTIEGKPEPVNEHDS